MNDEGKSLLETYQILDVISQTDQCLIETVYNRLDKKVYIKRTYNSDKRDIFNALRCITYKGVPKVHEIHFAKDTNTTVVVEEKVEGRLLKDIIATNEITSIMATDIASQLFETLNALQSVNIIHRDIKPDNIFIDIHDNVKLIDYGISRLYKHDAMKDTGMFGTIGYAPPEQFGFIQTSYTSDIYAAGVTILETLGSLKCPVLRKVAGKCKAFDPSQRYETAEEALLDMRRRKLKRTTFFSLAAVSTILFAVLLISFIYVNLRLPMLFEAYYDSEANGRQYDVPHSAETGQSTGVDSRLPSENVMSYPDFQQMTETEYLIDYEVSPYTEIYAEYPDEVDAYVEPEENHIQVADEQYTTVTAYQAGQSDGHPLETYTQSEVSQDENSFDVTQTNEEESAASLNTDTYNPISTDLPETTATPSPATPTPAPPTPMPIPSPMPPPAHINDEWAALPVSRHPTGLSDDWWIQTIIIHPHRQVPLWHTPAQVNYRRIINTYLGPQRTLPIAMTTQLQNGRFYVSVSDGIFTESFVFEYRTSTIAFTDTYIEADIILFDMTGDGQFEILVGMVDRYRRFEPERDRTFARYNWIAVWCIGYTPGEGFWLADGMKAIYDGGTMWLNYHSNRELSSINSRRQVRLEGRALVES